MDCSPFFAKILFSEYRSKEIQLSFWMKEFPDSLSAAVTLFQKKEIHGPLSVCMTRPCISFSRFSIEAITTVE